MLTTLLRLHVRLFQLKMLLILVGLGVTGIAIRAAIFMTLCHLWGEAVLLLVVNNNQLVDWKRAVDIFELGEHLVSLSGHLINVHVNLRGTDDIGRKQSEQSQYNNVLLHFYLIPC